MANEHLLCYARSYCYHPHPLPNQHFSSKQVLRPNDADPSLIPLVTRSEEKRRQGPASREPISQRYQIIPPPPKSSSLLALSRLWWCRPISNKEQVAYRGPTVTCSEEMSRNQGACLRVVGTLLGETGRAPGECSRA